MHQCKLFVLTDQEAQGYGVTEEHLSNHFDYIPAEDAACLLSAIQQYMGEDRYDEDDCAVTVVTRILGDEEEEEYYIIDASPSDLPRVLGIEEGQVEDEETV